MVTNFLSFASNFRHNFTIPRTQYSLKMDFSDKTISSSTSSKFSSSPKSSYSDENSQNYIPLSDMRNPKKVLAERNESSDLISRENLFPENSFLDPKLNDENSLVAESYSRPYNPFTNYLSPRPRFLRYKPNRRRGIFLRQENVGLGEENNAVSVTPFSSFKDEVTGIEEDNLEEEDEGENGIEEDNLEEEDEGEDEEERFWTVKELRKLLLVTASLVLCTCYITSMNTSNPSFDVSEVNPSGFGPILNQTAEFGNFWDGVIETTSNRNFEGGSIFVHQEDGKNIGCMGESKELKGEYTEPMMEAAEKPKTEESSSKEMAESAEKEAGFLEQTVEDDESIEITSPSNLVNDIFTAGNQYEPPMEAIELEEDGDTKTVVGDMEEAENFECDASEITMLENINHRKSSLVEITNLKELEKLKSELIEFLHTESLLKLFIGLSAASAILTSLVFSLQSNKTKDDEKPEVSINVKPLVVSPMVESEKIITRESPWIKPNCDRSSFDVIEDVDSFETLSYSIHSRDEMEDSKEFYHQEAPAVQLLGEFLVGEISSSVKKKNGLKNMMMEAKGSSFSVSVEEKSMAHTNEQALSEFSTMDSPSYGSFTTEKKIFKKDVGRDDEVKQIATPVRRSTRIRNRIVSP